MNWRDVSELGFFIFFYYEMWVYLWVCVQKSAKQLKCVQFLQFNVIWLNFRPFIELEKWFWFNDKINSSKNCSSDTSWTWIFFLLSKKRSQLLGELADHFYPNFISWNSKPLRNVEFLFKMIFVLCSLFYDILQYVVIQFLHFFYFRFILKVLV